MKNIETTLCLLRRNDEILLALKKRGFGEGKYNGVGGKLELGETPEQAMLRETKEEINVIPTKYEFNGVIEFIEYYKGEKQHLKFYLYIATEWEGEPEETEEMKPYWFKLDGIPYDNMFKDDSFWLPLVLEGKRLNAKFEFDEEWNLINKEIEELD